ncbi:MAG TPA: NAD(P)H-dependent oxidoreductase [Xanthobacteraceae bacterium]|nr:NAD(P)H-dependent oxidoreductase [Xanthobacteraceae bacterium]
MPAPKILVMAGSIRTGSFNARLAALAAKELTLLDADVTHVSLIDYPMPIYDGDDEAKSGPPENAVKLKRLMSLHRGVFITSPEYNASIAPLLKNTLDWVSRVREEGEPALAVYRNRFFALGAASNGAYGGYRSLIALRHVLELGCGAIVLPDQVAVREAATAFDEKDNLRDERTAITLKQVLRRLVDMVRQLG